MNKYNFHSTEMQMETDIMAIDPQKYLNRACNMIPKSDSHVLTTIYILETIFPEIPLERDAKGKKQLQFLESYLIYS